MNSQTVQVHIASLIDGDYKYLALKRSPEQRFYPSIWQTVTGKVEAPNNIAESFIQTAMREMQEETGLSRENTVAVYNIPYVANFTDYRSNTVHSAPVIGIVVDKSEIIISEEHSDYKWISVSEAEKTYDLYSHKVATQIFRNEILNTESDHYRLPF